MEFIRDNIVCIVVVAVVLFAAYVSFGNDDDLEV